MNHTDANFGGSGSRLETSDTPVSSRKTMPDVASEWRPEVSGDLQRVGMSGIELVIRWQDQSGEVMRLPAHADAYVSLNDDATKGIHMSRLFLALVQRLEQETLDADSMRSICRDFLESHSGISLEAFLEVGFSLPSWRSALLSDYSAPRHYPVTLRCVSQEGTSRFE